MNRLFVIKSFHYIFILYLILLCFDFLTMVCEVKNLLKKLQESLSTQFLKWMLNYLITK